MSDIESIVLGVFFLLVAVLFAAVGQAGASGYLAVMGLAGLDPEMMKPTALALNIMVAAIGTFEFWRAGLLSWRTFYPFGVLGLPLSVIGGGINLPTHIYHPVVGSMLLMAAIQLFRSVRTSKRMQEHLSPEPPIVPALLTGSAIGLVSGMIGTGGGIFLAPIHSAHGVGGITPGGGGCGSVQSAKFGRGAGRRIRDPRATSTRLAVVAFRSGPRGRHRIHDWKPPFAR